MENVRSFLGLAGYYRAFSKNFASIASPLTRLLKKDVLFSGMTLNNSFNILKDVLTRAPILAIPDYSLPFTLCSHPSALGIGAVRMQTEESKPPYAIAYASRGLTAAESKYSVTHCEAILLVSIQITAVIPLFHGKNFTGRLARCYLTIQQFGLTFKYLHGKANTVADVLSRNTPVSAVIEVANFSLSELHITQRQDTNMV